VTEKWCNGFESCWMDFRDAGDGDHDDGTGQASTSRTDVKLA
jgi:hypothetical protein